MNRLTLEGVGMTSRRTRDRLIQQLSEEGVSNSLVLDIMANTPRHIFLEEALAHRAYENTALPIGHGQTISQPYIVARMTELLLSTGGQVKKVLEVGTGCGYQTAILAQLVDEVWTVERIKPLQEQAKKRLRQLGLRNVHFQHADGGYGWPTHAPYDGILAAAAPREIPMELAGQLGSGAVLVMPVGSQTQYLTLGMWEGRQFVTRKIEPVRFVPLVAGVKR